LREQRDAGDDYDDDHFDHHDDDSPTNDLDNDELDDHVYYAGGAATHLHCWRVEAGCRQRHGRRRHDLQPGRGREYLQLSVLARR
jgi:hypothetical protein